jgi:hypothetical protein
MPLIGSEHMLNPHRFEIAKYDETCGFCARASNHRLHQPLWWRLLNPKKQFRR